MKREKRAQAFFISTAFGLGSTLGFHSVTASIVGFLMGTVGMIIFYADIDT